MSHATVVVGEQLLVSSLRGQIQITYFPAHFNCGRLTVLRFLHLNLPVLVLRHLALLRLSSRWLDFGALHHPTVEDSRVRLAADLSFVARTLLSAIFGT